MPDQDLAAGIGFEIVLTMLASLTMVRAAVHAALPARAVVDHGFLHGSPPSSCRSMSYLIDSPSLNKPESAPQTNKQSADRLMQRATRNWQKIIRSMAWLLDQGAHGCLGRTGWELGVGSGGREYALRGRSNTGSAVSPCISAQAWVGSSPERKRHAVSEVSARTSRLSSAFISACDIGSGLPVSGSL